MLVAKYEAKLNCVVKIQFGSNGYRRDVGIAPTVG